MFSLGLIIVLVVVLAALIISFPWAVGHDDATGACGGLKYYSNRYRTKMGAWFYEKGYDSGEKALTKFETKKDWGQVYTDRRRSR